MNQGTCGMHQRRRRNGSCTRADFRSLVRFKGCKKASDDHETRRGGDSKVTTCRQTVVRTEYSNLARRCDRTCRVE